MSKKKLRAKIARLERMREVDRACWDATVRRADVAEEKLVALQEALRQLIEDHDVPLLRPIRVQFNGPENDYRVHVDDDVQWSYTFSRRGA